MSEDRERKVLMLAKGSESIAFHITCIREGAGVMMQSKTLVIRECNDSVVAVT